MFQQAGGLLNWTQPLDNRSIPPDETARMIGISKPASQGWLFPYYAGPRIATDFKVGMQLI